ncbi:type 2 DNA topoisomerase 6 subunit B-like isoform X2 [Salvia miltiorrhiza]|uniref:type 2 DNA topoisomerase 6 subunit B-like isoform X2 n=1 Tax=Salvia miltiorrhiza TaxID=226208 RepID=UPI0025AC48B0|nr:type 2 DNA topoisomerase 6 subunit B-like isoform X2 [Salvia miltiorrhiza]
MDANSVEDLLKLLISSAFRRCRMLDDLCRLSVFLRPRRPSVLISVSDTGTGSILEEFSELKFENNTILSGKWDGVLSIMTTSSSDREIHHLKFDFKEVVSSRRLVRLSSATKNGAKFSGTEVSLSLYEEIDGLVTMLYLFLQKILLLKAFKIAIELIVESGGGTKSFFLQNGCSTTAMNASNIHNLMLGLEEYVSKHGNKFAEACHSCFSIGKNLKVGTGIACSRENQQNSGQVMEVVIIISNISMSDQSSCSRLYGRRTEVLYFRDFAPCSMPQPSLEALNSIDWKNYGLVLKSVGDQDGITLLEWENLPPCSHIDIALHIYDKQTLPCSRSNRIDRFLTRKALKLALTDLKKRNVGTLLSERAVKICNHAPDLAKSISGLIMSSLDLDFKRECFSLLGLPSPESEKDIIENCIKDKIISVVATNDSGGRGTKEAPVLFKQGYEEEYEGAVLQF